MSETVDPVQTEDLLTSLRRLVADTQPAPLVNEHPQPSGRLVLTPSLRIATQEDTPSPDVTPDTKPSPLVLAAEDGVGMAPADPAPEHDIEDDGADATIEAEPEPPHDEDASLTDVASDHQDSDTAEHDAPTDDAQPEGHADEESFDDRRAQLEATIAELEVAVQDSDDQWEPDGSEATRPPLDWAQMEHGAPDAELVGASAVMAAMHPDTPEVETAADTDVPTEDEAVEPPMSEDTDQDGLNRASDDGLDDFAMEDMGAIDEEMLREIIRDVLREELRGPLGERITRNLRKLTRREIYRILASEDLG